MTIYDKLYAEAEKRMAEAGMAFSVSREAYSRIGGKDPFLVVTDEGRGLKGEDFFQYFFYRVFNRAPEQGDYGKYLRGANFLKLNRDDVLELFIANHIRSKRDATVKGKQISGLTEWKKTLKAQGKITAFDLIRLDADGALARIKTLIRNCIVHPVWMLLPQKTRETIKRKLSGRG